MLELNCIVIVTKFSLQMIGLSNISVWTFLFSLSTLLYVYVPLKCGLLYHWVLTIKLGSVTVYFLPKNWWSISTECWKTVCSGSFSIIFEYLPVIQNSNKFGLCSTVRTLLIPRTHIFSACNIEKIYKQFWLLNGLSPKIKVYDFLETLRYRILTSFSNNFLSFSFQMKTKFKTLASTTCQKGFSNKRYILATLPYPRLYKVLYHLCSSEIRSNIIIREIPV